MVEIINPAKRTSRMSTNACETSVEGTIRRAPVPDRALRCTSLRVEGTPWDRMTDDHLLEENKRGITRSENAGESASVST